MGFFLAQALSLFTPEDSAQRKIERTESFDGSVSHKPTTFAIISRSVPAEPSLVIRAIQGMDSWGKVLYHAPGIQKFVNVAGIFQNRGNGICLAFKIPKAAMGLPGVAHSTGDVQLGRVYACKDAQILHPAVVETSDEVHGVAFQVIHV